MQYEGLIREILNKYKLDYEEYYDIALIGLAKAYKIFDEKKGYKFHTLAYNCIKNALLQQVQTENYHKRKSNKGNISIYTKIAEDFEIIDTLKSVDNVEQEVIDNELKRMLNKYIDELDFDEKSCILLRFFSSAKPKDIAEFLEIPIRAETKLYLRALTKLRRKKELKQWLD